jgi:hypothetical protein
MELTTTAPYKTLKFKNLKPIYKNQGRKTTDVVKASTGLESKDKK